MSEKNKFAILDDASNAMVIKYVDRNFPGVLIQGDTLKTIYDDLQEVEKQISKGNHVAAEEALSFVQQRIGEVLVQYEMVLKRHELEIPYYGSILGNLG